MFLASSEQNKDRDVPYEHEMQEGPEGDGIPVLESSFNFSYSRIIFSIKNLLITKTKAKKSRLLD